MSEISEYKEECMRRIKETQKYKKYSEDDLIDELYEKNNLLQQKENIIKEVGEYIKKHSTTIDFKTMRADYNLNMNELLEILDKGE